ncbi:MAG: hypothetical protein IJ193_05405 [Bacilli bacterium]|nr:hypothetical protein [Bacilli bacterium]
MAKKKRPSNNRNNNLPKEAVKVKNSQDLDKNVNSIVDEIEKTHPMKKIDDKVIEELETTMELKAIKEELAKQRQKEKEDIIEEKKEETKEEKIEETVPEERTDHSPVEEVVEVKKEEVVEVTEPEKEEIIEEKKEEFIDDFDQDFDFSSKKEEPKKDLSKTNSYRFSFDDKRLSESDSLDTSFLEGRLKNAPKGVSNKKPVKKVAPKKAFVPKKQFVPPKVSIPSVHRPSLFVRRLVCAIVLVIVSFLLGFAISYRFAVKTQIQVEKVDVIKEVKVADDNYVFLGDSITDFYDLGDYYKDLPVINSGINGNNTQDVLDSLNSRVYLYNPSKVFILLGTNDYVSLRRNDSIKENITKIVEEIHKHRPLAQIYIESMLPVTIVEDDKIHYDFIRARDNKEIEDGNEILKKICKDTKSTYIDLYKLFYDDKEGLKLEYTKDGLHLNDSGYRIMTDEIMKYIKNK